MMGNHLSGAFVTAVGLPQIGQSSSLASPASLPVSNKGGTIKSKVGAELHTTQIRSYTCRYFVCFSLPLFDCIYRVAPFVIALEFKTLQLHHGGWTLINLFARDYKSSSIALQVRLLPSHFKRHAFSPTQRLAALHFIYLWHLLRDNMKLTISCRWSSLTTEDDSSSNKMIKQIVILPIIYW